MTDASQRVGLGILVIPENGASITTEIGIQAHGIFTLYKPGLIGFYPL
ncbi:hypothetical protein [Vibrio variabilis]|nr:hypothetical protein [Vibrio variabilis]